MSLRSPPPTVLLVDDERWILEAARRTLPRAYNLLFAANAEEALAILEATEAGIAVIVSDLHMPGMDGAELLSRVGNQWPTVVRIALTGDLSVDAALQMVNAGHVFNLIHKPASEGVLAETIQKGLREHSRLLEQQRLAILDNLTGLGNRRAFDRAVSRVHARALRGVGHYALLMIDVDQFRQYNDEQGQPSGDRMLSAVARALESARRTTDEVFRYGGEEFVVLLADSSGPGMLVAAERHRAVIEAMGLSHPAAPSGLVTVSIGAALFDPATPMSWSEVLECAEQHLHQAKQSGRNRVHPSHDPTVDRP